LFQTVSITAPLLAGAGKAAFHGLDGTTQDGGDFRVRLVLIFGKNQRASQILRQRGHRAAHGFGPLAQLQLFARPGAFARQRVSQRAAGFLVLRVERNLRMPGLPAETVPQQIGGDGVKPGAESGGRAEAVAILIDAHESFLRQLAGLGLIRHLPQQIME
jgi:hypothetical protein